MSDVSSTFSSWSSTESSNKPADGDAVGTGLGANIRMLQADVAAWRDQVGWGGITLTSVSGANTVTATCATAGSVTFGPTSLSSGMRFMLLPASSNTGAATLNITSPNGGSALGAKSIFLNNAALVGYEMRANCPVQLYYDGTQFHIISGAHGGDGIPIGTETNRYFATAPSGHLLCDGSAVSRTTYADLFAVVSTTWGSGNGSTTFNLPNMARRVSVGSGGSGTSTLANSVGSTGGEETHTLTGAESGTSVHNHTASSSGSGQVYTSGAVGGTTVLNDGTGSALQNGVNQSTANPRGSLALSISTTVDNSSAANASSAHNNMPPSAVVYKCIKY